MVFTIIISEKGGEQRRVDFDKPEITIGRVQGNDVILPKGNVSKRHSRIVLKDGKFIIVDLKSTNGTYVNGRKITSPLVLKGADKIYIGDFILTLEDEAGEGLEGGGGEVEEPMPPSAPPIIATTAMPPFEPPPAAPLPPGMVPASSLVGNPPPPPKRPSMPPPPPREEDIAVDDMDLDEPLKPGPGPRAAAAAALASRAAAVAARDLPSRPSVQLPTPEPRPTVPMPTPEPIRPAAAPERLPPDTRPPQGPPPGQQRDTRPPKGRPGSDLVHELNTRLWAQLDLARVPADKLGEEALWQRAERTALDLVEQLEADGRISPSIDQNALIKDALQELLGLGPLDELLADEAVVDIIVNRPDQIQVDRGSGLSDTDRVFSSEAALRLAVERMLLTVGRRLDAPLVDARLRDGARLTAAMPPLAVRGPCLTLRKANRPHLGLDELVKAGALSPNMAEFLVSCVNARRNVVICGGAGAGKSVLLGALAATLPGNERVVSVEDVAELPYVHPHWVALEARPPEAPLLEVLRGALRMRPDRLVVGEVRGPEAYELLLAMASAHDGTLVGVAAEGAGAALSRLESLARLGAWDASPRALRELCAQAVHIIVQLTRWADGTRRVTSIAEVTGMDNDSPAVRELFRYQAPAGKFAGAGVVPRFYEQLLARGHKADPALFR